MRRCSSCIFDIFGVSASEVMRRFSTKAMMRDMPNLMAMRRGLLPLFRLLLPVVTIPMKIKILKISVFRYKIKVICVILQPRIKYR